MPNWCDNELKILGPKASIDLFVKERFGKGSEDGEDGLDFDKVIPYPEHFRKLDEAARAFEQDPANSGKPWPKDGFNSGGYEWCISNWGTKWGACDSSSKRNSDRSLTVCFNTAWSPPLPVINALSKLYLDLRFSLRYWEGGAAFKGTYVAKGGEVVRETEGKYYGPRGG